MAASGLAPAPGDAAFPGRNGLIATVYHQFDRGGGLDVELRLLDRRGNVRARFSRCSRDDESEPIAGACPYDPAFSPNGRRIAHSLGGRLALQPVSGGQPVVLPKLTDRDDDPYPSPDGAKLVFTGRFGGKANLFEVNADGTGLRRLTHVGGHHAAWSPKGEIVYCAGDKIWRLKRGGGRAYVAAGQWPDWSPSGKTVAYVRRGSLYRVAARGRARRRLVHRRVDSAAFSPDGRSIAFARDLRDDLGASLLTVRSADGSRIRRIAGGGEQPIGSTWVAWQVPAWQPLSR